MTQISALTFAKNDMTSARRGSPISQLECTSGAARYEYSLHPDSVQCVNVGNDGVNVQWKCDANLDPRVKFGKMHVSCEGYSYAGDSNVLVGSCGLQYGLEYDHAYQQPEQQTYQRQQKYYSPPQESRYGAESKSTLSQLFDVFLFVFVIYFVYALLRAAFSTPTIQPTQPVNSPYGMNGGFGMGGGGMGMGVDASGMGMGYYPSRSSWYPSLGTGWWPGFATGGILGNLWNRPWANRAYTYPSTSTYQSSASSYRPSSGGSRRSTGFASSSTR